MVRTMRREFNGVSYVYHRHFIFTPKGWVFNCLTRCMLLTERLFEKTFLQIPSFYQTMTRKIVNTVPCPSKSMTHIHFGPPIPLAMERQMVTSNNSVAKCPWPYSLGESLPSSFNDARCPTKIPGKIVHVCTYYGFGSRLVEEVGFPMGFPQCKGSRRFIFGLPDSTGYISMREMCQKIQETVRKVLLWYLQTDMEAP